MSSRESHITNIEKTQPAKEFSKKKINEDLHNKSLTDSVTIRNIVRNKVCLSIFCSERYFKVPKNSLEHCNIEGLLLPSLGAKIICVIHYRMLWSNSARQNVKMPA